MSKITGKQLHIDRNDFIVNNRHGYKLQVSHYVILRNTI
jgi:hypothetical protein